MKRLFAFYFLAFLLCLARNGYSQAGSAEISRLDSLGEQYFQNGQLDSSAFYHRQALSLAKVQGEPVSQLNAYNWLFVIHYYTEAEDSMANVLQQMSLLADQIVPREPEAFQILSSFWGYKSFYHYSRGELAQNITAVRKALELYEQQADYDTSELAIKYQNLGIALEEIGEYEQANQYSRQALELLRPSSSRVNLRQDSLTIITSVGTQLNRLNRSEEANQFFLKGEHLAEVLSRSKDGEVLASTALYYIQRGFNFFNQDNFPAAEATFRKAQQLLDRNPDVSDLDLLLRRFRTRNALARGRTEQAGLLIRDGNKMIEKHFPERPDQIAANQELLGEILQAEGDHQAALAAFQTALVKLCPEFQSTLATDNPDIQQMVYSKNDLLRLLGEKSESLRSTGNIEDAFHTYRLAIKLFHNIRQDYVTEASRLFLSEQMIPLFAAAAETAIELQNDEVAFQLIEQGKALLLQEALQDSEAFTLAGVPPALSDSMQQLQLQYTYWGKERYNAAVQQDTSYLKTAEDKLFKISNQQYLLQERIRSQYPVFFDLKFGRDAVRVPDIQSELLDAESALIEYFVTKDQVFIFGISQGESLVKIIPKEDGFTERMERLLSALHLDNRSDPAQYAADAFAVYNQYLAPVLDFFPNSITKLYLIPDGVFSYLPFEALLTESPAENAYSTFPYLIKKYSCSYAYSSTLLVNSQGTSPTQGKQFVGFAPAFNADPTTMAQRSDLGALRYNIEAVEAIKSLTSGTAFTAEAASKANLLTPQEVPLVLHLSTHARMDDKDPMGSKIYLADGDISTREIYQLPYSCQMVVLSACETGTGKFFKGEGMMSLARAFMQSGSPSVVTSLWKVDDRSTSELMVAFYKQLMNGKNKDEAMREAKLDFLATKESEMLHHPYYWAAFIHIGDPANIHFPGGFPFGALGLIGLLGLGLYVFFRKR